MERGLHHRYFQEYETFQRNLACGSNQSGGNVIWDTVDLSETIVPFVCYFVGIILAWMGFIFEKFRKLHKQA